MRILLLALAAGVITALFGAIKDTRWERFRWKTFFRSPIITLLWAAILLAIPDLPRPIAIGLVAVTLERATTEIWKGLFRRPDRNFFRMGSEARRLTESLMRDPHLHGGRPAAAHEGGCKSDTAQ